MNIYIKKKARPFDFRGGGFENEYSGLVFHPGNKTKNRKQKTCIRLNENKYSAAVTQKEGLCTKPWGKDGCLTTDENV